MLGFIAAILSGAIIGSGFLPWLALGPLYEATLFDVVRQDPGQVVDSLTSGNVSPLAWLFVLSFPLALASVMFNVTRYRRLLSLVTGLFPVICAIGAVFGLRDRVRDLLGQVPDVPGRLVEVIGQGVWVYVGAGALLLILSLVASGRR
ncbi:hypothetical protein [Pelagovum pacificum]|uniref:Uncharacterized protein n=1 Tax=Pelagovum pacificum TaxID=2588711 RepID=A0A5C5GCQ7_9RHOB|nr:hypothetical protein [Pelagovum pacificum]QQA44360.1 hypothetical protein I8N54_07245 [Pelagovum pacificum]TNY32523.1 hypothetical protein FHY64_04335 [Pelagovum pacificum]